MKFISNKAVLKTHSCGYSISILFSFLFCFFCLCFFLIGDHAGTGCTNEWNGGTYLRARWAFVLKRVREREKMKHRFHLGTGSELRVAVLSVSPWLCAAHCTDCICLRTGCETNQSDKDRSCTHTLTGSCNRQTTIRIKILFHTLLFFMPIRSYYLL